MVFVEERPSACGFCGVDFEPLRASGGVFIPPDAAAEDAGDANAFELFVLVIVFVLRLLEDSDERGVCLRVFWRGTWWIPANVIDSFCRCSRNSRERYGKRESIGREISARKEDSRS